MVRSSVWVSIMVEPDLDLFRFLLSRLLLEILKEVDKSVDRFAVYLLVFAMADNHFITTGWISWHSDASNIS